MTYKCLYYELFSSLPFNEIVSSTLLRKSPKSNFPPK